MLEPARPSSSAWRRTRGAVLVLLGAALALSPVDPLGIFDDRAEAWLDEAIVTGAAVYATVRVLNGSVSVLQDSELNVSPAGVGASIAVGQILDPLNDMAERFSSVVVTALAILAVERVLHEISAEVGTTLFGGVLVVLGFLGLFLPASRDGPRSSRDLHRALVGVAGLLFAIRVAAPIAALGGEAIHARYLEADIERARGEVRAGLVDLDALLTLDLPADDGGFLGTVRRAGKYVTVRLDALRDSLGRLRARLDDLIAALVELTGLYLAQILLQGFLLPLAVFGATYGFGRLVLRAFIAPTPRIEVQVSGASTDASSRG